jgi:hypothetical protein
MTDLIYDFISTGVDLILVGSVLAAMIVMMRGSANLTTLISHQQVVTEEFDYYLKYTWSGCKCLREWDDIDLSVVDDIKYLESMSIFIEQF